jgi:hypothetical protein
MTLHIGGDTPVLSPRDLNFLLYECVDGESLCERDGFTNRCATPPGAQDRPLLDLSESCL